MAKWDKVTCLGSGSESEWELESGTQGLLFCCCCWIYTRRGDWGAAWTVFATAGAEPQRPLSLCLVPSGAEVQTHSQPICSDAGNAPESSYRCCEEDSSVLMNVENDFKQCVSSVWKGNRQDSFFQQLLNFCWHSPPVRKRCREFFVSFVFIFISVFVFHPALLTKTIILLWFLISSCWHCNHFTGLKCS